MNTLLTNTTLGPLIESSAGNFYGVTQAGGAGSGTVYALAPLQTPDQAPIFIGAHAFSGFIYNPFSFTPKATFGASGSGAAIGNSIPAQTSGNSIKALLAPLLPQSIRKASSQVDSWALAGMLPNYLTFDSTSGTISGTPTQAGTFTVTLTPYNAMGPGSPQNVALVIISQPGIDSAVTSTCPVGKPFSYKIDAFPPATSFGATNLPGWLTVDTALGAIAGTPPNPGIYVFDTVALNSAGSADLQVTLTAGPTLSTDPTIISPTTSTAYAGTNFYYRIVANNMPTTASQGSYSALTLPHGFLFNSATGEIYGLPTTQGTYLVPISATNTSNTYSSNLTITVGPGPTQVPDLPASLSADAVAGSPFSYQIPATGILGSYNATIVGNQTGLPPGLLLNTYTGVISGMATVAGNFQVTITATNGAGASSAATLKLNVAVPMGFSQWEMNSSLTPANGFTAAEIGPANTAFNDGVPNLFKYLFDINPSTPMAVADRAALPVFGMASNGDLTLTFREYSLETGITLHVQTSPDLQTWTSLTQSENLSTTTYTIQPVGPPDVNGDQKMEVEVQPNGMTRQFLRLNVTMP